MTEIEKKLAKLNGTSNEVYGQEVDRLVRMKYTLSQELAILRQRDEKPEEWEAYNAYCEECKEEARFAVFGEE